MASIPSPLLFLLAILLFLYFSPDPQAPAAERVIERIVDRERAALNTLNNSTFGALHAGTDGDRGLNLTGLELRHGFHWDLLDGVRDRARDQARYVLGEDTVGLIDGSSDRFPPLYRNITGFVGGAWHSTKTYTGPHINLSAVVPHATYSSGEWARNLTSAGGEIRIYFEESGYGERWNASARSVVARVTIREDSPYSSWWGMRLYGVHLEGAGTVVLTTTSDKFDGIFALPHFALSRHAFTLSQQLLNRTLSATIARQQSGESDDAAPWSSVADGGDALFSVPHCEYVIYLQQHPLPFATGAGLAMHSFEDELRSPRRIFARPPPEMTMSMVGFSPDCGFIIESDGPPVVPPQEARHLSGPKVEAYTMTSRRHVIMFALVITCQLLLLVGQMKDASTPSTRSRISFYTIALLALGDGFALLALALVGMSYEALTLILLATAYLAFLSAVLFGMGFLKEIWTVQSAEHSRRDTQSQTPTAPSETLPLPVTAQQAVGSGATPITLPPDAGTGENANAEPSSRYGFGTVYFRFYLVLFVLVFLSLHATTWASTLQAAYSSLLIFAYASIWTPQVYRNAVRNCRKALRWDFVIGQSLLRLAPFYYAFAYRGNVLLLAPDRVFLAALTGWLWLQVCALAGQQLLGPRFFVRDRWLPPAYDYHPVLRADEEGASLPTGAKVLAGETSASPLSTTIAAVAGSSSDARYAKVLDCAICMQDLAVPVVASDGGVPGLLARRAYMVTPCRHIFHSVCLEGWLRYRLQCPICRESLPSL